MMNIITRATKKLLRENSKNVKRIEREILEEIKTAEAAKPTYHGRKNECIDEFFSEICCLTQNELKSVLPPLLKQRGYENVIVGDGFIYAKGDIPVVLTAHMDTVHKVPVVDYYEVLEEDGTHVLHSPQGIGGDDRCGIYMILRIVQKYKCSVVFCEDEESGCVGSKKFCKTEYIKELSKSNYMIGLDRAHATDAVFYDCENYDFTKFILDNTGYKECYGSYSDISYLAPAAGIAAVNLSCGYYNAHTTSEYVVLEEMYNTINTVMKLLEVESEQFDYVESQFDYTSYSNKYNGYSGYGNKQNTIMGVCAYYTNEEGQEEFVYGEGYTELECWGVIFTENPGLSMDMLDDFEIY